MFTAVVDGSCGTIEHSRIDNQMQQHLTGCLSRSGMVHRHKAALPHQPTVLHDHKSFAEQAICVSDQVRLRKLMIDMVLGTDMKQHCHIISRFQTVLQVKLHSRMMTTGSSPASGGANAPEIKFEDPADRSMLLQVCGFSTSHCLTRLGSLRACFVKMLDLA